MDFQINKKFILLGFTAFLQLFAFAQNNVTIKGQVVDATNNEPLPFATVYFVNTGQGELTDIDGEYTISTDALPDTLAVSYLGYAIKKVAINPDVKKQTVNFALDQGVTLEEVIVKDKRRVKYKRGNPAWLLWKKVIAHKEENRPQTYDYYEYDKYEKIQLDLNNITDKFRNKKSLKKFQFIFDYVDTSDLNGKTFLPIYIREAASKMYYRKDPEATKEHRSGIKVSGLDDYFDEEGFNVVTDLLYRQIDIYEDDILIFDKQFRSPLGGFLSDRFYRFYLGDTIDYNGQRVIDLEFTPVNKSDIAFTGHLYILADSTYAVVRADFGIPKRINLNFVNDLSMIQDFEKKDDVWVMDKDLITVDFSPMKKSMGFFATRSVSYENHLFNKPREESIYSGTNNIVDASDAYAKDDQFWNSARQEELTAKEEGVYQMIDTLQKVPAFRTVMDIGLLLVSGYKSLGPIDIGPVGAFYSFNEVEGFRLRLGGQTNLKFHPKIQLEGYGAYGFKDQEWKYAGALTYSFKEDFKVNPRHYFKLSYQHETKFVGQNLKFVQEDNFLLSFKRGSTDKMLFMDKYVAEYFVETNSNISFQLTYDNTNQRPIGSLIFQYTDPVTEELATIPELRTSEFGLRVRFAPNEQFLQGRNYRTPLFNKYPVLTLDYTAGVKNMLGGDHNYHKLSLHLFKRFYLSMFGNTRFEAETGKVWADGTPYFLLQLPRANQTFSYRTGAFNMMNFMEFVNDQWASVNIEHFFEGFFFNRIPLLRRLKLREVVSFKGIYGSLEDQNNPNLNKELIQFITDDNSGDPVTYTLEDEPYMEASVGIYNIFKFGRIDFVKRLNYLDQPNVPEMFGVKGLGLRIKVKVEF